MVPTWQHHCCFQLPTLLLQAECVRTHGKEYAMQAIANRQCEPGCECRQCVNLTHIKPAHPQEDDSEDESSESESEQSDIEAALILSQQIEHIQADGLSQFFQMREVNACRGHWNYKPVVQWWFEYSGILPDLTFAFMI